MNLNYGGVSEKRESERKERVREKRLLIGRLGALDQRPQSMHRSEWQIKLIFVYCEEVNREFL